jgi:phospholipid-binding lipoprotein MlaA
MRDLKRSHTSQARWTVRLLVVVLVCTMVSVADDAHAGRRLDAYNKGVLSFNRWMLRWVFEPVGRGYNFVTPKWGQRRVTAFFANLDGSRDIINSALQAKGRRAGAHSARLLVNTTIGVAGLFDVGDTWFGWEAPPPETFDETLGVWRVPLGPYFIIPILGDSSPRAFVGLAGDFFANPMRWFLPFAIDLNFGGTMAVGVVQYTLQSGNLLASGMPSPRASEAAWDSYRRSRFDFPEYEIGRENFIADSADRVVE